MIGEQALEQEYIVAKKKSASRTGHPRSARENTHACELGIATDRHQIRERAAATTYNENKHATPAQQRRRTDLIEVRPEAAVSERDRRAVNAATPILSLPRAHIQDHQCCIFCVPPLSPPPHTHNPYPTPIERSPLGFGHSIAN